MPYTHLVFDADNTLFDFHASSELAFSALLKHHGIEQNPQHYPTYNVINAEVWKLLENGSITQEELRGLRFERFLKEIKVSGDPVQFNTDYLNFLVQNTIMLDGAIPLLEQLSEHFYLAIITNGLKEVQRPRIAAGKLGHYFKTIVVSDEIGVAKPDPAFFDYTFKEMGQPEKSNCLVIGDSLNSDMKGGLNYNLDTCWFNPHQHPANPEIPVTFQIQKLEELYEIINFKLT